MFWPSCPELCVYGWTTVLCGRLVSRFVSAVIKKRDGFLRHPGNFHWAFLRGSLWTRRRYSSFDPDVSVLRLSDDVCDHHAGADHGRVANRVTFKAYMLFLTAWLTLVYFPFVHMVWGGGVMASWACWILRVASSFTTLPASRRWLRSSTWAGARLRTRGRIRFRWWPSVPACSGSGGTASTRAASFASMR